MDNEPLYQPWGKASTAFWDRPSQIPADPSNPDQLPALSSAPEREPVPARTAASSTPEMQQAYRDGIQSVVSAFVSKDPDVLQDAAAQAARLDQTMTAEYGEQDARTTSIREMRGWLAHLTGRHEEATRWYLHTAGLLSALFGNDDQRTRDSARRGVTTWLAIADSSAAHALAPQVLAMAVAVDGEGSGTVKTLRNQLNKSLAL